MTFRVKRENLLSGSVFSDTTSSSKNKTEIVAAEIADWLSNSLSGIDSVSDAAVRKAVTLAPGFGKGRVIAKGVPGPCAESKGEVRTGVFLVLGTGDQAFKRVATAYHCCQGEEGLDSVIFVVQTDSEAWWRENSNKPKMKIGNGNRCDETKLLRVFNNFSSWPGWCDEVSMISICTEESDNQFELFMSGFGR
jgi:hypothetical protein